MNGRSVSIISEALGGSNIDNCPHACLAKPCGPLAKCVPSLESYECQCNPQNEQCNKAEEIPINFIEHHMQQGQLGPLPSAIESDNEEEDEDEDDGDSEVEQENATTSTTSSTSQSTSSSSTTTTISTTKAATIAISSSLKMNKVTQGSFTGQVTRNSDSSYVESYKDKDNGDDVDDEEGHPTPFALPVKSQLEEKSDTSSASSYSPSSDDYYYAAYEDADNDDDVDTIELAQKATPAPIQQPINLGAILNIPRTIKTEPMSTDSETTRWSSITRDGERLPLVEAEPGQQLTMVDNENRIDDNGNSIWAEEDEEPRVKENNNNNNDDDFDFQRSLDEEQEQEVKVTTVSTKSTSAASAETFDEDYDDDEDMDEDLEEFLRPVQIVLPPWREDKSSVNDDDTGTETSGANASPFDNPNAGDPFLKSHEFLVDMDKIMKGKEELEEVEEVEEVMQERTTATSVRPEPTTKLSIPVVKKRGACFTGLDSFFHYSDGDTIRRMSKTKLDINLRFKAHSSHGLLLWTGRHAARINDNFLLLGIEDG